MTAAPIPTDEYLRLLDLAHYRVLDTPPEEAFDRITRLTAHTLRLPVAIINFVDQDRQFGKSCHNTSDSTAPREHSFCAWTILSRDPFIVSDTRRDLRFQDNPLVQGEDGVRFYAGVPLTTAAGHRIGSLCVTHTQPHTLTAEDVTALQDLGALVEQELQWRVNTAQLTLTIRDQNQTVLHLEQHLAHAHTLEAVNALFETDLTPEEVALQVAALVGKAVHADWTALLSFQGSTHRYQPVHTNPDIAPALLTYLEQRARTIGPITRTALESTQPVYADTYQKHPDALRGAVDLGVTGVGLLPLGEYGGCTYLLTVLRTGQPRNSPWRASDRALIEATGRSVRAFLVRRAAHEKVVRSARHDARTGIFNRRAFDETFRQRLESGVAFTLAAIDLDHFKAVNDQEGHSRGDQVLTAFAQTLAVELAPGGQVFRTGGDEFMLLLQPETDEETLLEAVDQAVLVARTLTVVSVGASLATLPIDHPAEAAQSLIQQVDARLYARKRQRKSQQSDHSLSSNAHASTRVSGSTWRKR
jgi:diguanylate cyclase (GGDEF)-like protein